MPSTGMVALLFVVWTEGPQVAAASATVVPPADAATVLLALPIDRARLGGSTIQKHNGGAGRVLIAIKT